MQSKSKFTIALCVKDDLVVEIGEQHETLEDARAAVKHREQDARDGGQDARYVVVIGEERP